MKLNEIKRKLKKLGIKQREVAARAGVAQATVTLFLCGKTTSANIRNTALQMIAEAEQQRNAQ